MRKKLSDILKGLKCQIEGDVNTDISGICFDSREVDEGKVFVAIKGTRSDGHEFIGQAIEKGAVAIVCEENPDVPKNICKIVVDDASKTLGLLASRYFGNPSSKLKVVGITGTNGKSSIAHLLYQQFSSAGYKVGLLSTICNRIANEELVATHTTPDTIMINKLFGEMVSKGCTHVFMEVSSHAIHQNRISGIEFDVAVFTNITHEHLDYHKTFKSYIDAKKLFFDGLGENAISLINADDKHAKVMVQNTISKVVSYGLLGVADYKAKIMERHFDGMLLNINGNEIWTKLTGDFNAYNLLAVFVVSLKLGMPEEVNYKLLSNLNPITGRFEIIRSNDGVFAIIDYAHTPDALQNILKSINNIRNTQKQLITVVGAGGNRDKAKRPIMGKISSDWSDKVIFTSDNPRDEDPNDIINQMMHGVEIVKRKNVLAIADRREAIKAACMMASSGDVVLIAGRGHESYQVVNDNLLHFSDKMVVSEVFMINKINLQ